MKGQMMEYPLTTSAILEYGNRVFPDKQIISKLPDSSWHEYSFSQLYLRTQRLAHALVGKLGVKPGDRIATFAWNQYQHIELYYAIPGAGAICHTVNIRLSKDQISYIINHAADKIVFVDVTLVHHLEQISERLSAVTTFVIINGGKDFQTILHNYIHYEELLDSTDPEFEWYPADENDACGLCYTSGTTGNPKGVLYSHRSTYLHALGIMQPNAFNMSAATRALLIVPQFHVMAWGFPFVCLLAGADMILPGCHMQPDELIEMIQRHQVNLANGVPAIWLAIYDTLKRNPPKQKLPLKEYLVGGSALPVSLIESFQQDFDISGIHAWGMTETSPLGTVSRLQPRHEVLSEEEKLSLRGKQGIEISGVEIRIVEESGTIAPRDGKTIGEIEIRGAWVLNSYYNSEEDLEECFNDGWFKTGDVGNIDEFGFMLISDRKKDLIKSGGEWISSIALEIALVAHPDIKEACVIAIPDEKWTERPVACIVVQDNRPLSYAEMNQFLSGKFASYQLPDQYLIMDEIPKTSVGKLDKKELRRLYSLGLLRKQEIKRDPADVS